jgi:Cytochrome P460
MLGSFDNGAIIVFEVLEATECKRKVLGAMEKDGKRFAETGGWGFEGLAAGDPGRAVVGQNASTACFACHTAQKDHDYVVSLWRE